MLDVNNKSQSSSEVYTITQNSGRDDSQGTLTDTKINSVQLFLLKDSKTVDLDWLNLETRTQGELSVLSKN